MDFLSLGDASNMKIWLNFNRTFSSCVCVFMCTHAHMKVRGQYHVSSSMALHLDLWGRLSCRTWSSLIWLGWLANKLQTFAYLCSPNTSLLALGLQMFAPMPGFYVGARESIFAFSCLCGKRVTKWAISPSPFLGFKEKNRQKNITTGKRG